MKAQVYSLLRYDKGTIAVRICRACYLALPKARRHPDFAGPALLDFEPLQPGQVCYDCKKPLQA